MCPDILFYFCICNSHNSILNGILCAEIMRMYCKISFNYNESNVIVQKKHNGLKTDLILFMPKYQFLICIKHT